MPSRKPPAAVQFEFEAMMTNVFEWRYGGRWLMVYQHATMMPA